MADAYTQMANKLANFPKPFDEIAKLNLKPSDWQNTPGGLIMAALPNNPSFDDLFNAYTAYGRNHGWTWDPGIPGAKKGPLLDGNLSAGECAIFAANLLLMAQLPPPFGLGMPLAASPEYWPFYGKHKVGFISDHNQPNIISALQANVSLPAQLQHPTSYYLWENHKVLIWNDQIYDPSYGTISARTEYLGPYQVKPGNGPKARATVTFNAVDYVVSSGPSFSVEYLWKIVPDTVHPGRPFQGPYTIDQVDV